MSRRCAPPRDGSVRGFTLLEALAAVITLGLLAATVVPLLRQLGRRTFLDRVEAQSYLRTFSPAIDLEPGPALTVAGHPGWRLVVSELLAGPEPPPPAGCAPPAGPGHHWLLVSIQTSDNGESLAETLVAVLRPAVRP